MSRYFIEILNNSGDVQTRHKFTSLPIGIGRAYDNDIILDDAHTAAQHAIIDADEDGRLTIRDCGSQNGIRHKGKRENAFLVNGDAIFYLGHTQLRVRTDDYVVAPELVGAAHHRWEGWPLAVIAVSIISAIAFSNAWISDIENSKTTPYVMSISLWLTYSVLWAGIWSLANRVFGGAAHFSRHLFTLGCGLAVLYLWGYIAITLAYAYSWTFLTRFGNHIEIIILATTVYYHLHHITPRKAKRLKIICALFAVFGSGLVLMKNYQSSNQYADELYMSEILPPAVRMSRNHSLEEFSGNIDQLKSRIDAERERAKKEK